jgi:SAM-dependent methyltransferase
MSRPELPRPDSMSARHALGWAAVSDFDSRLKNSDPSGELGTAARLWINRELPRQLRRWFPRTGLRVLDIGCGDGLYGTMMAAEGFEGEYTGVDLFPSHYWSERTTVSGPLRRRFEALDAHDLPGTYGIFNAIISVTAFEHLADDEQAFRRAAALLQPGSRAIIIVPSTNGPWLWGRRHAHRWYRQSDGQRLARAAGLDLVLAKPAGGLASLLWDGCRFTTASLVSRAVAGLIYARYRGDRTKARLANPWIPDLTHRLQFAHLQLAIGRSIHRVINRALLRLDVLMPLAPTSWLYVFEKSASR